MKSEVKDILIKFLPVWLCAFTALCLIIGGFFVPPIGVIDGSVIQAVGEIIGIIAILEIPHCIDKMNHIQLKHNNTEINMSQDSDEDESLI